MWWTSQFRLTEVRLCRRSANYYMRWLDYWRWTLSLHSFADYSCRYRKGMMITQCILGFMRASVWVWNRSSLSNRIDHPPPNCQWSLALRDWAMASCQQASSELLSLCMQHEMRMIAGILSWTLETLWSWCVSTWRVLVELTCVFSCQLAVTAITLIAMAYTHTYVDAQLLCLLNWSQVQLVFRGSLGSRRILPGVQRERELSHALECKCLSQTLAHQPTISWDVYATRVRSTWREQRHVKCLSCVMTVYYQVISI